MQTETEPLLMTVPNAANMIARGVTFIYEAISDGKIRAVKSDKRTLVVVESLREYVASLPPAKINYDNHRGRSHRGRSAA